MNKKKIIALIAVCVIAVVSIAVVPTYAAYHDSVSFSATIQSRSFEIDTKKTDLVNVKVSKDETFRYGFFTSSETGNCKFHFSIDTNALPDCTFKLSKRDESTKTYSDSKITKTSGQFVDEDRYSAGEKRLYLLEITPNSQDIKVSDVLASFSSNESDVEVPVMKVPENGAQFEGTISNLVIENLINQTKNGFRIVDVKFIPRTDTVNFVMLDVNKENSSDTSEPQIKIIDTSKPFYESFTIVDKSGGTPAEVVNVILTIYLPINKPISNFQYSIDYIENIKDYILELENIVAEQVFVSCPQNANGTEIEFSFDNKENNKFSQITIFVDHGSQERKVTIKASKLDAFKNLYSFKVVFPKTGNDKSLTFEITSETIKPENVASYFIIEGDGIEGSISFPKTVK